VKRKTTIIGLGAASAVLCAVALAHRLDQRRLPASDVSEQPSATSLYQLSSQWTTDDERKIHLNDLKGDFRIVALIFTSCPGACPTLVKELQNLDSQMPSGLREITKFVLVSIDPERDTTEALRRYRQKLGLDPGRFTLMRGNAEDVRELAATLGFNYQQTQGVEFVHSRLVTLLNPHGEIVFQQPGVAQDPERLVAALDQARGMAP